MASGTLHICDHSGLCYIGYMFRSPAVWACWAHPAKRGTLQHLVSPLTHHGEVNGALGHLWQDLMREEKCTFLGFWSKAIPLQQKRNSSWHALRPWERWCIWTWDIRWPGSLNFSSWSGFYRIRPLFRSDRPGTSIIKQKWFTESSMDRMLRRSQFTPLGPREAPYDQLWWVILGAYLAGQLDTHIFAATLFWASMWGCVCMDEVNVCMGRLRKAHCFLQGRGVYSSHWRQKKDWARRKLLCASYDLWAEMSVFHLWTVTYTIGSCGSQAFRCIIWDVLLYITLWAVFLSRWTALSK